MSLYERVPRIDLSPEYNGPPLSATRPADYFALTKEILFFPQRVRDYARDYARKVRGEPSPPAALARSAWADWLRRSEVQRNYFALHAFLLVVWAIILPTLLGVAAAWFGRAAVPWDAISSSLFLIIFVGLVMLIPAFGLDSRIAGAHVTLAVALPFAVGTGLFWLAVATAPAFGTQAGLIGLVLLAAAYGLALGIALSNYTAAASYAHNGMTVAVLVAVLFGLVSAGFVARVGAVLPMPVEAVLTDTAIPDAAVEATPEATAQPAPANATPAPVTPETAAPAARRPVIFTWPFWTLFATGALAFLLGALRPLVWLRYGRLRGRDPSSEEWLEIPRVTPLPIPGLHEHLTAWLDFDWKRGMENAATVWNYTGQQEAVRRALHEVLRGDRYLARPLGGIPLVATLLGQRRAPKGTPAPAAVESKPNEKHADRVVEMINRIADEPESYPWEMVSFESPLSSLQNWWSGRAFTPARTGSSTVQRRMRRLQVRRRALHRGMAQPLPTSTPEQAVTAGFWYLERGYLTDAVEALRKAPSSPLARELLSLVEALNTLSSEENLLAGELPKLPQRPLTPRRKESWDALEKVQQVVMFGRLARESISPAKRDFAVDQARALLADLRSKKATRAVELRHLRGLAELWEADLSEWLATRSKPQPIKPADNPFIFAEPLRKQQMFVNRERELADLKLAWNQENLQPVVLFGQPLIGKTSLLYNARHVNQHVELAWFHLGHSNRDRAGIRFILAAICAAVQQATVLDVFSLDKRRAPLFPAIESANDPFAETEQFIRAACALLLPRVLILVMDDFDQVQRNFTNEEELDHFLNFLEHLFQMVKNFNVVFVSQHTPLLFEDRFSHNFAGTVRIHAVGLLDRAQVAKLLRPAGFPHYFTDAAVESVHRLTGGHPYLVQLLAHVVVQSVNRRAADQKGEPVIEVPDVEAVLNEPEVSQREQSLYRRMHDLARQAGPEAEAVLVALAAGSEGRSHAELSRFLVPDWIDKDELMDALLYRMQRYGMVERSGEDGWRLRMELWRRWEERTGALPQLPTAETS